MTSLLDTNRYTASACTPKGTIGQCSVCKAVRELVTEHCHKHNYIRGRICLSCNQVFKLYDRFPTLPNMGTYWNYPLEFIRHAISCPDCADYLWSVMIQNSVKISQRYQHDYLLFLNHFPRN